MRNLLRGSRPKHFCMTAVCQLLPGAPMQSPEHAPATHECCATVCKTTFQLRSTASTTPPGSPVAVPLPLATPPPPPPQSLQMLVARRKWKMQYVYDQLSEQEFRARVVLIKSKGDEEELPWTHALGSKQKAKHAAAEIGLKRIAHCPELTSSAEVVAGLAVPRTPSSPRSHQPNSASQRSIGGSESAHPPEGAGTLAGTNAHDLQSELPAGARIRRELDLRADLERADLELARRLQVAEHAPQLDAIISSVLSDLAPTPHCQLRQNRLIVRLGRILKDMFGPKVHLEVFGSTVCNLAGKSSDLDMTFTPGLTRRLDLKDKKAALRQLSKALQSQGLRAIPVLGARVPIIKIRDQSDTRLAVDLSVENELPVFKSRLLLEYSLIDKRFAKLVVLVKAWAKARAINSAAHGTFNSFGLSLLVVHYLQNLEPAVLPRLNEATIHLRGNALRDAKRVANVRVSLARDMGHCDGIRVRHHTHTLLRGWGSDNSMSMAVLVHDFFHYFSRRFDWNRHVVSVTSGGLLLKSQVSFHQGQHTFLCIQDPLDLEDNCARSVGQGPFVRILEEFERAYTLDYEALLEELHTAATRSSQEQRDALKQEQRRRKREAKMQKKALMGAAEAEGGSGEQGGAGGAADTSAHTSEDEGGGDGDQREGEEEEEESKTRRGAGENDSSDCGSASETADASTSSRVAASSRDASASNASRDASSFRVEASSSRDAPHLEEVDAGEGVGAAARHQRPVSLEHVKQPPRESAGDGLSEVEHERRRQRMLRFSQPPLAVSSADCRSVGATVAPPPPPPPPLPPQQQQQQHTRKPRLVS